MAILKNSKGEPIEFVMYDDSILDRHSERILVQGISLVNHKQNPVALYQHRSYGVDAYPIGRWVNVRKDGSRLLGNLDIDDEDSKAREVGGKIERGYLRAVSISVKAIERSSDPLVLLQGQRYRSITKSDLIEVSIVIIPSHPKAVPTNHKVPVQRSFFDVSSQSFVSLSSVFPDAPVERGVDNDNNHEKPKEKNMSDYSEVIREFGLGLSDDASKEQVFAALRAKLSPAPTPAPTTTTSRSESSPKQVDDLIAWGKVKGLIDSGNESVYRSLAEGDYSKAVELIEKSAGATQGQKPDEQGAEDLTASVKRALVDLAGVNDKKESQKPDLSKMPYNERMAYKMREKHGVKPDAEKGGDE